MRALPFLVLLAPTAAVLAAQPPAAVSLTYHTFETPREMMDLSWGGEEVDFDPSGAALKGLSLPPGVAKPSLFRVRLPWMRGHLLGLAARSAGATAPDRLWLDWSGDRAFGADEEYLAEGEENLRLFRAAQPLPDGSAGEKRSRFQLLLHEGAHLHVVPAGCYEGEADLGGRRVRVGLVDRDQDLTYSVKGSGTEDLLLLDFDGDGVFHGASEGGMARPWELEAAPLRRLSQMPGGGYARVLPASDGKSLSLEPDTRPLARLRSECPLFALEVESGGETLWVRGRDGEATLPAGNYDVGWATVGMPDGENAVWSAALLPPEDPSEGANELKLPADSTLNLPFGPPFRVKVEVEPRGSARLLRASLADVRGNVVGEVYGPDGARPPAAELRVLDTQGKALGAGKGVYGEEFSCSYSWRPSRGSSGRAVARAEWPLGPFEARPAEVPFSYRSYGRRYRRR